MDGAINISLGEIVHFDIVTHDPTTGSVSNADSPPIWTVYEEDYDTPMLFDYFSLRTNSTGDYRAMFNASSDNISAYGWNGVDGYGYGFGFEEGKFYNIIAEATVGGITAKTVVFTLHIPVNGGLSSDAIDAITADIMGAIVDGTVDLETALKRILSTTCNSIVATGTDPKVLAYKDDAGTSTVVTHSVPTAGTGRTSS